MCRNSPCLANHAQSSGTTGHRDPHLASDGLSAAGGGAARASNSRLSSSSSYCSVHRLESAGGSAKEAGPWPLEPAAQPTALQVSAQQQAALGVQGRGALPLEGLESPEDSPGARQVRGGDACPPRLSPVQREHFQTPQVILLGASVQAPAEGLPRPLGAAALSEATRAHSTPACRSVGPDPGGQGDIRARKYRGRSPCSPGTSGEAPRGGSGRWLLRPQSCPGGARRAGCCPDDSSLPP